MIVTSHDCAFQIMDLVSLACEEIGLDLDHETNIEDRDIVCPSEYVVNLEEESNLFDVPMLDTISYYGDLSNTVFTDSDGKETKLIVQGDSR